MPLILDIAPSTAIVYAMDAYGYVVGVRNADDLSIGTQVCILNARQPLDPIILEEDLLLNHVNSDLHPEVAHLRPIATGRSIHGGVPIRFLGPGTGGISGRCCIMWKPHFRSY
jgi:hypothetical protein